MNLTWLKNHISGLFILLFLASSVVYAAHVYQTQSILWGDTRYYYAYTRSLVVDRNINFENEAFLNDVGYPNQPTFSPLTNRVINKFSPGAPILWIPGFLLGQGFSYVWGLLSPQKVVEGYGFITQFTVGLTAVFFSTAGLYLFYLAVQKQFGKKVALATSATLFITTQLLFYTAVDPLNSHSASFLFSSLLFFLSMKWVFKSEKVFLWQVIVLGGVAGWLALIRNQDIIFCVPIGLGILLKEPLQIKNYLLNILKSLVFAVSAFLPLLIQLTFTYYLFGQYNTPYAIGGETFYWLQPDFIRILFSQQNGFFFFAPIVLFCLWGLVIALRKKEMVAAASLISFVLTAYVIASWAPEILGGPYGSRMFTSTLPWLGFGAATLLNHYWKNKQAMIMILLLIFVCSINTIAQTFYMLLTH